MKNNMLSKKHLLSISVFVCMCILAGQVQAADSGSVKAVFANPPGEYSPCPFWVWNNMLTEEQVVSTLGDLAGQGIRQVFVHPRPGLMTPYLSEEWFRLWKVALKEAERLDMNLWIYDENSYPSGFAGGFVPEAMPQSRGKGLAFNEATQIENLGNDILGVFRISDDGYENVTGKVRDGEVLGESSYLVVSVKPSDSSGWFGGKYYVDLLAAGVTEKFLEVTMEAYRKELGGEFGGRIPGVFTDEPHLGPAWNLHWTGEMPEEFEKRWGYSLIDNLPGLTRRVGDWRRLRHNYFQTLLDLFIERWGRPYYEYCAKNELEFTGHYWEHEWPRCLWVPDNMAMSAWQQIPGIDMLINQYREDTHAQFGNIRSVKELSSVANQLGRERTLCEAYGASGWEMRLEDMKRIGDWLYVLGVNLLNEHLSYISIRGARKRDHPPSFSYHEPWWEAYHVMVGYFGRLSAVMSQGEQINTVLVIEPTTTVWMYQAGPQDTEYLEKVGGEFQKLVVSLAKAQVEYDIGCEDIIARHSSVEGKLLKVGRRRYETVVISPLTENLNSKTMELLEVYCKGGGTVLCCGSAPELVDGLSSDRVRMLSQSEGWKRIKPTEAVAALSGKTKEGFRIRSIGSEAGILLHHRRRLEDGELLFITNTSIDSPCSGVIESSARGVERWDLESGTISPYLFSTNENGIKAGFELAPCGSLLLFLSEEVREPGQADSTEKINIAPAGPVKIHRIGPNVLTLDYVDVTAGNQTKKNTYFYKASQLVWQQNGMEDNPWDNAVQFRDELITKKFGADSGFEATYRFNINGPVPKRLEVAIERPDLYTISCNGIPVSARKSSWWLDKSFGKIDISSAAKEGENSITIKARPMTIYHELEAAYVLGDFSLKAADSGFVIVPEGALGQGQWDKQGHPFYAEGVSYTQGFDVAEPAGRYYVQLADWYGSVAKVSVNGKDAGYIYHQPWECDVTNLIAPGVNTIEITVIGTLRNTLGPHHSDAPLGAAWPGMFQQGPEIGPPAGEKYRTIGYGLFKPFRLLQAL